jgi:prepilin signal peptidase PulO-like enzyme (type II secretory pathway)
MTAAGLLLGWKSVFIAIFIAAVAACLVMLPYQKKAFKQRSGVRQEEADRETKGREFAFGPFLVFGVLAALFFGRELLAWYLGLFGL